MTRLAILHEIEQLDAERDCQRIMHLSFGYEFAWDSTRALEVALYRTYCVPSISALLDRTGEFYRHAQRRYDDTALLVAEMCQFGYEHGRGQEALERMNWVHGHFKITNADFLYVLSTFIYERARWINGSAGGRRPATSAWRITISGAKSACAWTSTTSRQVTRRWRPGPVTMNARSSGLRRRISVLAPQRATCLPAGIRVCWHRSCTTPFMRCSMTRCWRHLVFRSRCH